MGKDGEGDKAISALVPRTSSSTLSSLSLSLPLPQPLSPVRFSELSLIEPKQLIQALGLSGNGAPRKTLSSCSGVFKPPWPFQPSSREKEGKKAPRLALPGAPGSRLPGVTAPVRPTGSRDKGGPGVVVPGSAQPYRDPAQEWRGGATQKFRGVFGTRIQKSHLYTSGTQREEVHRELPAAWGPPTSSSPLPGRSQPSPPQMCGVIHGA